MRALVVFYSRSGATETVADDIREGLLRFVHVDVEWIRIKRYEPFFIGSVRLILDCFSKSKFPLVGLTYDPTKYQYLVVGTPVWSGSCTPPIQSYLTEMVCPSNKVGLFTTQSGDPNEEVIEEMENMCNGETRCTMMLKRADIKAGNHHQEVDDFVGRLLGMK